MKQRTALIVILTLGLAFLSGCSVQSAQPTDLNLKRTELDQEPVISEEMFNKIPKNLRPSHLEERDDTTVIIQAGDDRTIKEYRVNGFLYSIQVIPKVGKTYYLIAADNKGNFIDPSQPGVLIPSWTIFQWR